MNSKKIKIGDETYLIKAYDSYCGYIEWKAYKLRKIKKWWQIGNYEVFPYVSGSYRCYYGMTAGELLASIKARIIDKKDEEEFRKEWNSL